MHCSEFFFFNPTSIKNFLYIFFIWSQLPVWCEWHGCPGLVATASRAVIKFRYFSTQRVHTCARKRQTASMSLTVNGSLPNGTKPLPEPMLTNHQSCLVTFTPGQFLQKWSRGLSLIATSTLHSYLPGATELMIPSILDISGLFY